MGEYQEIYKLVLRDPHLHTHSAYSSLGLFQHPTLKIPTLHIV